MANLSSVVFFLVQFVCVFKTYLGLPVFFRGRLRGGNVGEPFVNKNTPTPREQWFTQRLTHFDTSNTKTWQQKYYVNGDHYERGGPVFLMIGGEGPLSARWMTAGQWVTRYAPMYHALCVALEHRFYGSSHPTSDLSTQNLAYLSSEQALADLANFQVFITEKLNLTGSKWVSFGGSYPGSLSAWYRMKYPHLLTGAVSSSAPLNVILNFKQYKEVVQRSLRRLYGESCVQAFRNVTARVGTLLQTDSGRTLLENKLRLCNAIDPTNHKDIATLYSNIAGNIEGIVQYNRDNRAFEGARGTNITIQTVCTIMTDPNLPDVIDRYARLNNMIMAVYSTKCLEFSYSDMVKELRDTSLKSPVAEGGRQWTYQTCAEFGFFQSSDAPDQPFGHAFPLEYYTQQCVDIFGPTFNVTTLTSAIKQTNENYGALSIKTSNTMFVNGNVDPWHALGLFTYDGPKSLAIVIDGTAHCANMYPDSEADPFQLRVARDVVASMIGRWVLG